MVFVAQLINVAIGALWLALLSKYCTKSTSPFICTTMLQKIVKRWPQYLNSSLKLTTICFGRYNSSRNLIKIWTKRILWIYYTAAIDSKLLASPYQDGQVAKNFIEQQHNSSTSHDGDIELCFDLQCTFLTLWKTLEPLEI